MCLLQQCQTVLSGLRGEHPSVAVSSCVNAADYNADLLGSSGMAICRVTNDKFKDFKDLRNTHLML